MKKINPKKVLFIVFMILSIFIIIVGIMAGGGISSFFIDESSNLGSINIDGSDFTGLFKIMGMAGSIFLSIIIIVCSFLSLLVIWVIYLIISLVIDLIKKEKIKQNGKEMGKVEEIKWAKKTNKTTLIVVILIFLILLVVRTVTM